MVDPVFPVELGEDIANELRILVPVVSGGVGRGFPRALCATLVFFALGVDDEGRESVEIGVFLHERGILAVSMEGEDHRKRRSGCVGTGYGQAVRAGETTRLDRDGRARWSVEFFIFTGRRRSSAGHDDGKEGCNNEADKNSGGYCAATW